jgi:hypothetical protein
MAKFAIGGGKAEDTNPSPSLVSSSHRLLCSGRWGSPALTAHSNILLVLLRKKETSVFDFRYPFQACFMSMCSRREILLFLLRVQTIMRLRLLRENLLCVFIHGDSAFAMDEVELNG